MEIIFNELSTKNLAESKEIASEWMFHFFDTSTSLEKRLHKKVTIRTTHNLRDILISDKHSFVEWLHTIPDRDYLRKIIATLTPLPLLDKYPYYNYNGVSCEGLGIAHKENKHAISYPHDIWSYTIYLIQEYFTENEEVKELRCEVKNLSKEDHVYYHFPKLQFEHHKKHDNHRLNLADGESTLWYDIPNDQKKVQKLLDCSFSENNGDGERRYNFDLSKGLYIEFNCHKDNCYHGYHIIDTFRVPHSVKQMIKEFETL